MSRHVRLAVLVVLLVVVQVTLFPHLRVADVVPDLGLVAAIAVGFREGPEAGALVGFAAGLAYDLFLSTPLGLSALSYALVGYFVGVVEGGLMRAPGWLPTLLGAIGGLAGGLVFLGIGVLVGVEVVKGLHGVETISFAALYDAIVAPIVFFLVNRALGSEDAARSAWSVRSQ
jgi:rod shape-determining protein MreD